jgi:hypothetical protein
LVQTTLAELAVLVVQAAVVAEVIIQTELAVLVALVQFLFITKRKVTKWLLMQL